MRLDPVPMLDRGFLTDKLKGEIEAVGPSRDHGSLYLTVWPLFRAPVGCRWTSDPDPTRRAVRIRAIGTPISGHDVSGTGWQSLGGLMQSITTMMPVWQCGHSRNDCPVKASKRSR